MKSWRDISKYVSAKELHELGLVQEINRLVLHPAGFHMMIAPNDFHPESDQWLNCTVLDGRDEKGGLVYDRPPSSRLEKRVSRLSARNSTIRMQALGSVFQSTQEEFPSVDPVLLENTSAGAW